QLQRWNQRVREGGAVAAGVGAAERDVGGENRAQRRQLQRWDQRVRKRRAVAAGARAAERDVGGKTQARLSYNAAISACQKGKQWQWQRALSLLRDIRQMKPHPDLLIYGIVASMCEHGGQRSLVQSLTREMCGVIAAE
ncbi:unnamed protein product, partial [Prorocentrum cordatum]